MDYPSCLSDLCLNPVDGALSLRLSEVASAHGGKVRLHGRLFAHCIICFLAIVHSRTKRVLPLQRRTRDRLKSKMKTSPFCLKEQMFRTISFPRTVQIGCLNETNKKSCWPVTRITADFPSQPTAGCRLLVYFLLLQYLDCVVQLNDDVMFPTYGFWLPLCAYLTCGTESVQWGVYTDDGVHLFSSVFLFVVS